MNSISGARRQPGADINFAENCRRPAGGLADAWLGQARNDGFSGGARARSVEISQNRYHRATAAAAGLFLPALRLLLLPRKIVLILPVKRPQGPRGKSAASILGFLIMAERTGFLEESRTLENLNGASALDPLDARAPL